MRCWARPCFFGAASCSCGDDDDDDKADPNKPLPDDDTGDDDDSAADDDVDDDTGDDDTSDGVMPHFLGVWDVTGTDDELGAYEGQVEFWVNENGEFRFSRSVRYADQTFDGYDVYSGWDGTAETADNAAEATVTLRRVDYIRAFGDLVRGEDEKTPEVVTGTFAMGEGKTLTLTAGYTSAPAGLVSASETLTYAGENGDLPIFFMDDTYYPTHEPMPDWLHDLVFLIMTDYHALPFFDDYRDREEFDVGVHYYPHFRTGFRLVPRAPRDVARAEQNHRRHQSGGNAAALSGLRDAAA
ncbi:MAG: hypothetical protein M5R36_29980 [Deltaproteobacteria bacterium]|nr:hypothetical protein [Deltaproteobacteria bacterium]